jgi:hypothetical protein
MGARWAGEITLDTGRNMLKTCNMFSTCVYVQRDTGMSADSVWCICQLLHPAHYGSVHVTCNNASQCATMLFATAGLASQQ